MLRIGVLTGGGGRDDLARQLATLGVVDWCDRPETLVGRATQGAFDVVVAGLHDEGGQSVAPMMVELAAYRPALPVILHARLTRVVLGDLLAVLTPGLRVECAVRPFARLGPMVRAVLSPDYRPGVAPLLLQHFAPRVPDAIALIVAIAILMGPERRSVEELAAWVGVSSRTIDRRLRRAGWASTHVVLHSFSALDAIWLMTEYGWSARRVQQWRAFPHPSSVTRLLATYAGTQPLTLVEDGGFSAALDHVTRVLSGAR